MKRAYFMTAIDDVFCVERHARAINRLAMRYNSHT